MGWCDWVNSELLGTIPVFSANRGALNKYSNKYSEQNLHK